MVESGKKMFEQQKGAQGNITKRTQPKQVQMNGYTELHHVAFDEAANERMVVENATFESLNKRDHNGNTPLMWASSLGNEQLVEALLDQGATVNMQNFVGETALFLAAARGFDRICSLLIENGADFRIATLDGSSPLHIASASGHTEVIRVLFSRGAYVNVADEEGDTPLHYAVREGHRHVVELLVKQCAADVTSRNDDSESPLDLAMELGENGIAQVLSSNHSTHMEVPEFHLYFGEDNEMLSTQYKPQEKEQQAMQVDGLFGVRSVSIF
jgi:ankyrin repeat protein